jgi:hypothetical protein
MPVKVFIVLAPPEPEIPDPEWEAEQLVFVKDGFSFPGFLIPVPWLIWQRMWLPLLGYLVFMVAMSLVELSAGQLVSSIVATGCTILFALEANNLRRWSLSAKGWRTVGEAIGRNRDEAEFLFFRDKARQPAVIADPGNDTKPARGDDRSAAGPPQQRTPATGPGTDHEPRILGLFPEAER